MANLRDLLSGLGYTDIRTHLQSGNAVFAAPDAQPQQLAAQIEVEIEGQLGFAVRCLIRTARELRAVIQGNPLTGVGSDGSRMMALFLAQAPDPALLAVHDPTRLAPEHIGVGDGVIYQWCPDGVLAAPAVSQFVEKHLGVAVTGRNWNTVTKLSALLDG